MFVSETPSEEGLTFKFKPQNFEIVWRGIIVQIDVGLQKKYFSQFNLKVLFKVNLGSSFHPFHRSSFVLFSLNDVFYFSKQN